MNRTQHLIASQPRPKRRVARPDVCSLQIVGKPTMAANDNHVARRDELPGALATHESKLYIEAWMAKGPSRDVHGRYGNNTFTFYSHKTRAALLLESRHGAPNGPRGVK